MNNTNQTTQAWITHGGDNRDELPDSIDWVLGTVDSRLGTPRNIDDFVNMNPATGTIGFCLPASPLNFYLCRNVKVYKCPGDTRTGTYPRQGPLSICRSVPMNNYIGVEADPNSQFPGLSPWDPDYINFKKSFKLVRPGPGNTFLITDEGPTINDDFFATDMATYDPNDMRGKRTTDVSANYYNKACNLWPADGHSDINNWRDSRTWGILQYGWSPPNNVDIDWLQSGSLSKILNPTR